MLANRWLVSGGIGIRDGDRYAGHDGHGIRTDMAWKAAASVRFEGFDRRHRRDARLEPRQTDSNAMRTDGGLRTIVRLLSQEPFHLRRQLRRIDPSVRADGRSRAIATDRQKPHSHKSMPTSREDPAMAFPRHRWRTSHPGSLADPPTGGRIAAASSPQPRGNAAGPCGPAEERDGVVRHYWRDHPRTVPVIIQTSVTTSGAVPLERCD